VLPIVLALLVTKPGGLVIIENPEAHLHPKGQSYLGRLIQRTAEAGVQVIIETHSDHLLNGIRVAARLS
ncbi:AAA family ATPase, partial [Vibrio parahaemolyticus]